MRAQIGNSTSSFGKWTRTPNSLSANCSIQLLAVESTTSLLSYINRDHKLKWCNKAFANAFALQLLENEELGLSELIDSTAYNHLKPLLEHAFRGNVTSFQIAVTENAAIRHFSGTLTPEKPRDGVTQALICQLNETTSTNRIQQELFNREIQLKLALSLSETGICEIDLHTKSVFCDYRLKSIVGFEREPTDDSKATLSHLTELVHADDRDRVTECFKNAVKQKSARCDTEFRVTHQTDQSIRWVHATGQYLSAPPNQAGRMFFIVQDITRHKTEEAQSKESRAKISHLLNHIPQLIWTTTAKGEPIYANGRFIASAGTRPRNWIHSVHSQDAHAVIGKWNASVTSGETFEAEYRLQDESGKSTWVLGRAVPVRDESGEISEWFGTATDINEKKEEEERRYNMQRKVAQLQTVATALSVSHTPLEVAQIVVDQGLEAVDAVAGCVILTEPTGGKLSVLYAQGYGRITLEYMKTLSLSHKLPVTDAIINREPVFLMNETEVSSYAEIRNIQNYESKSVAALPLMVQGEAIGALALSYNTAGAFTEERIGYLTILAEQCAQAIERARLFEAERLARRSAELATKAKSQFLANMSHEIRTPMNAILGFADLLADKSLNEDEREDYRRRIRMNGDQLMHLIDDVLDLTKMEAGKITLQNVSFSVTDLVRDILNSLASVAKRKGITTRLITDASVPLLIESDPVRLRQIVTSLVDNSIKFTDHGRIETRMSVENSQLIVEIEDTGIGISPELHERLFQPFAQGDSSVTRRFGGTGLGLVVSRGIAEAMGGTLEHVRSESSPGSIFRLTAPMHIKTLNPQIDMFEELVVVQDPLKIPLELQGVHVLLVEDSFDNEMLIRAYLKGTGVDLEVAHNGAEAVKCAMVRDFDVVLMDIQMPVMDGLEATRRLRGQNYSGPIIALSAHALPEEVERSIAAGCLSHLTKPIMRDVLIDQIRSFAPGRR